MFRRLVTAAVLLFVLVPVSVASAGVLEDRLAQTRSEGKQVKHQMAVVDRRQASVTRQITALNRRIAALDLPINHLTLDLRGLDYRMQRRAARIAQLKRDFRTQQGEIVVLSAQLDDARNLLASRVVTAYTNGDPGMLEQLAGSGSLAELFARQEALGQVVGVDQKIIDRINSTRRTVRVKRARNHQVQAQVRADIALLSKERGDTDAKRAQLQRQRDEVAGVRSQRDALLKTLNRRAAQLDSQLDVLDDDASVLQEAIRTGSVTYSSQIGALSSSGLIYPVSGSIVSPFGQRWGRLHAGIDIAVGEGTPVHAAASGVVSYASWMSGYGNMVQIQHAGILSTGYAHQSRLVVHVGQLVNQGDIVGFSGCTGHCLGPHVHFETRENGVPADPMKYL
ncbi:MAG: Peptidase [Thermoleophilia bacterium]|nr:Peptidase [Thermoleophilia bacterium]